MVKVGDKIRILFDGADHANVQRGDEFVVSEVFDDEDVKVEGKYNWFFSSYSYEVIHTTPPQKITQNGYEYSLVGPVKPEWLVDGAWVVNVCDGGKRLVKEVEPGVFNLKVNDLVSIRYHEGIRNQYRPHEPKDWKWGDWAMYYGKRVFVMSRMNHDCLVGISFPNIDGEDLTDPMRQWDFAEESELTPTF